MSREGSQAGLTSTAITAFTGATDGEVGIMAFSNGGTGVLGVSVGDLNTNDTSFTPILSGNAMPFDLRGLRTPPVIKIKALSGTCDAYWGPIKK